jgi:hypothetical protein
MLLCFALRMAGGASVYGSVDGPLVVYANV